MGLFGYLRDRQMRRKLIVQSRSSDWGVAESAIRRLPEALDAEAALQVLLPLSHGEGKRLVNPLSELPPTPVYEFSAGVHLKSVIEALGKLRASRAGERLLELIAELPQYASHALRAVGSPNHAVSASLLAGLAESWPHELRSKAADALWRMETEEALEAYIKIKLKDGTPFSEEETMRKAWASKMEEIRNPKPYKKEPVRRLPLPP